MKIDRVLADHLLSSLYVYLTDGLGLKLHKQPHEEMCALFEAALPPPPKRMEHADQTQFAFAAPRETLKTTVGVQALAEYFLLKWKVKYGYDGRCLIVRASEADAKTVVLAQRADLGGGNPVLLKAFGDLSAGSQLWKETGIILNWRETNYREPSVDTTGMQQSRNGKHYDMIFLDDLVNENNYESEVEMMRARTALSAFIPILNSWGSLIHIGTRWGNLDTTGYILELNAQARKAKEPEPWKIVIRGAYLDDGSLYYPAHLSQRRLDQKRRSMTEKLFTCLPSDAPVLMADWTEKPISEIKPGDSVIGYTLGESVKNRARLVPATVEYVHKEYGPIMEYTLSNGDTVRCTPNHKWLSFWGRHKRKVQSPYTLPRVGGSLVRVYHRRPPRTTEEQRDLDWIGGLIDGEGSMGCGNSGIWITQSEKANPDVYAEIVRVLDRLGIGWSNYHRTRSVTSFYLHGGRSTKIRLLNYARLAKVERLRKSLWDSDRNISAKNDEGQKRNHAPKARDLKIVSKELVGWGDVWNLQTSTGNYVAYGYATKNSQYLNKVIADSSQVFEPSWLQWYDGEFTPEDEEPASLAIPNDDEQPAEFAGAQFAVNAVVVIDPAATATSDSNATGMALGLCDGDGNLWIHDAWKGREVPSKLLDRIVRWCWEYAPRRLSIDTLGQQVLWIDRIQDKLREAGIHHVQVMLHKGKAVMLSGEQMKSGRGILSKASRIESLQPWFREGKIFLRRGHCDPIVQEYNFYTGPTKREHYDMLDALAQLPVVMVRPQPERYAQDLEDREMEEFGEDDASSAPRKVRGVSTGREGRRPPAVV